MRYDDRIIDEVQSANDIVEVISQYVPLKRSGKNFKGLCPFHQEKTPSFMVQPEKQIYHCFGCGVGGNVFGFLMKYENATFPEALRQLAERAHIQLPERNKGRNAQTSDNEKLYEAYQLACDFYHKLFMERDQGKHAREYFAKRHFQMPDPDDLKIGWSLDAWRGLFDYLSKKGFSNDLLVKSGLVHRSPKGNFYDAFRGRLMFPIKNHQGKVVAFGGRIIGKSDGPKYLNSPENPIFYKRRELFGLHLAKRAITQDHPQILVVEGYFDFLRLYQNGFKTTVATLGTSLTDGHVQLLKRYAEEAIVIYDGDSAGQSASLRGLEVFLEGGMSVKLVRLPEGYDPDDFVDKKGADAFRDILDRAQDFFDFKLENLLQKYNRSESLGLMKITNEFLETFLKVKNSILLDRYIRRLAASLGIDENSVRSELGKLKDKYKKREIGIHESKGVLQGRDKRFTDEMVLMSLALEDLNIRDRIIDAVSESDFEEEWVKELFRSMLSIEESAASFGLSQVLNRIPDEKVRQKLIEVSSLEWSSETKEKALEDCLGRLQRRKVDHRLQELRRQISQAEHEGDSARLGNYVREYQELLKKS